MSLVHAFHQSRATGFGLLAAVTLTLVGSCSSETTAPPPPDTTPASLTPVTGTDNQTAVAGTAVANPPSVTVTNAAGTGLSGVSVTFAVTAGGGSVTGASATTDAQGVATVGGWTLGPTAGNNTLSATVNSIVTTFSSTGTAGLAASVTIEAGDGQTGTTGAPVVVAPAVKVVDANNNAVSGASVDFIVTMGNGAVVGSPATTDANGIAAVTSWTLGGPGLNTLEASISGVAAPAVFTATAIGIPATVTIAAGDNQNASAGTPVPVNPGVEVRDASNNLLANVSVTFTVTGGGGSVTGANAMTDASGIATVGSWTLGTTPMTNLLDAVVAGLTPATFTAIGVVGPASQIQITMGDNQSATVGTALINPVQATIQDQFGNGVASESLIFSPTNGTVDNTNLVSDANGNASVTWTLGTMAGTQTLNVTAATTGVTPGAATAIATAGASTQIVVVSGDGQTRTVGTQLPNPLVFAIQDVFGNGVQSETINITPDGNGSVDNSSPTSDANGEVSVLWTLATTPSGTQNLNAAASVCCAVTPGAATATANAGTETTITVNGGDNQTAVSGMTVATPPSVLVTDQFGNPVAGVNVTFTPSGDGQVTGSPVVTNASGIATVGSWTLATTPGANTLVAGHGVLTPLTINATGT